MIYSDIILTYDIGDQDRLNGPQTKFTLRNQITLQTQVQPHHSQQGLVDFRYFPHSQGNQPFPDNG